MKTLVLFPLAINRHQLYHSRRGAGTLACRVETRLDAWASRIAGWQTKWRQAGSTPRPPDLSNGRIRPSETSLWCDWRRIVSTAASLLCLTARLCRLHRRDPLLHVPREVRCDAEHPLHQHQLPAVMHLVFLGRDK